MRGFFIIESLYKLLGLLITMMQARLLGPGRLGEFVAYQSNVFGYLNSASLLATDYKNLVAYQADPAYLQSPAFYQTLAIKSVTITLAWLSLAALAPMLTEFALWPYFLAIGLNFIQFDFLIYGHAIRTPFALVRLSSQLLSLGLLALFWQGLLDIHQFTVYQLVQSATLNLGILLLVRRYLQLNWARYRAALKSLRPAAFAELGRFFAINQFVTFLTTIEMALLGWQGLNAEKQQFGEGQRLALVLAPWVVFYLNYNIGKAKPALRSRLVQLVIALILLSPLTTLVLYGPEFVERTAQYNAFLLMFLMMALLQAKNLDVLAADLSVNRRLATLNIVFFIVSTLLMAGLFCLPLAMPLILTAFLLKFLIYHGIYNRLFAVDEPVWFLPVSLSALAAFNIGLAYVGYFAVAGQFVSQVEHSAMAAIKPWIPL